MNEIKVRQFSGVANQFIITEKTPLGTIREYFQSYDTVIAVKDNSGAVTLDPDWNYSRTTQKYLNRFLNSNKAEIERKIETGEYVVAPLN